jgi:hypothetical protein
MNLIVGGSPVANSIDQTAAARGIEQAPQIPEHAYWDPIALRVIFKGNQGAYERAFREALDEGDAIKQIALVNASTAAIFGNDGVQQSNDSHDYKIFPLSDRGYFYYTNLFRRSFFGTPIEDMVIEKAAEIAYNEAKERHFPAAQLLVAKLFHNKLSICAA